MKQYGLRIDSISIQVNEMDKTNIFDQLKNIEVIVYPYDSSMNIKEVENIEIVQVNISEPRFVDKTDNYDDVVDFLADSWNVKKKQITIFQKGEI